MAKEPQETRYWCQYCRIFIYNNRINREKHDTSPQHKAAAQRFIENVRRDEKQKERVLAQMGVSVGTKNEKEKEKNKSFYGSGGISSAVASNEAPTNLLSFKGKGNDSNQTTVKQPLGLAPTVTDNTVKSTLKLQPSIILKKKAINESDPVKTIELQSHSIPTTRTQSDINPVSINENLKKMARMDEATILNSVESKTEQGLEDKVDEEDIMTSMSLFKKRKN